MTCWIDFWFVDDSFVVWVRTGPQNSRVWEEEEYCIGFSKYYYTSAYISEQSWESDIFQNFLIWSYNNLSHTTRPISSAVFSAVIEGQSYRFS